MSYAQLIERLEAATSPDGALDKDILCALGARYDVDWGPEFYFGEERYYPHEITAKTDDAIALADRMLRGVVLDLKMSWDNQEPTTRPAVSLRWYPPGTSGTGWHATVESAPNIAISVCLATMRALERMGIQKAGEP